MRWQGMQMRWWGTPMHQWETLFNKERQATPSNKEHQPVELQQAERTPIKSNWYHREEEG